MGETQPPAIDRIENAEHLEDLLIEPTEAAVAALARLDGDEIPGQVIHLPGPRRRPVEQQQRGECGQTVRRAAEGDGHSLYGRGDQRVPALAEPLPDPALPEPQLLAVPPLWGDRHSRVQRPQPLRPRPIRRVRHPVTGRLRCSRWGEAAQPGVAINRHNLPSRDTLLTHLALPHTWRSVNLNPAPV